MRKVIPDSDMCSIPAASVNGSGLHSVQRVRDAGEFLMIIIRSAKGRRRRGNRSGGFLQKTLSAGLLPHRQRS